MRRLQIQSQERISDEFQLRIGGNEIVDKTITHTLQTPTSDNVRRRGNNLQSHGSTLQIMGGTRTSGNTLDMRLKVDVKPKVSKNIDIQTDDLLQSKVQGFVSPWSPKANSGTTLKKLSPSNNTISKHDMNFYVKGVN